MAKKNKQIPSTCEHCTHCTYIGEGDFYCDLKEELVIVDFDNNTTPIECGEYEEDWLC